MNKSETKHQAPSTRGWETLLEAAQMAQALMTPESWVRLHVNLDVRKNDYIPSEHRMKVMVAIAAAVTELGNAEWPDHVTEFLHAQLGKEGVQRLIQGSRYIIRECNCPGLGYHVIDKDQRNPIEELFSILGQRGTVVTFRRIV